MKLDIRDIKSRLLSNVNVEFEVCPDGNVICMGKLNERFKKWRSQSREPFFHERLSVIQLETCAKEIAYKIKDLPLALGNVVSDFETMDLITPILLLLLSLFTVGTT